MPVGGSRFSCSRGAAGIPVTGRPSIYMVFVNKLWEMGNDHICGFPSMKNCK